LCENQIEEIKKLYENQIEEIKKSYEEQLSKKDQIIKEQEVQIKILQTKLEGKEESLSIAKTAKGTVTNNIKNLKNLVVFDMDDRLNSALSKYTEAHFFQGAKGTAKWLKDCMITNPDKSLAYICTDKSREHFKFMNKDGQLVDDIKAQMLLSRVGPELIPIATDIRKTKLKEIIDKYNVDDDDSVEKDDLTK